MKLALTVIGLLLLSVAGVKADVLSDALAWAKEHGLNAKPGVSFIEAQEVSEADLVQYVDKDGNMAFGIVYAIEGEDVLVAEPLGGGMASLSVTKKAYIRTILHGVQGKTAIFVPVRPRAIS